jgi:hypothetical protein
MVVAFDVIAATATTGRINIATVVGKMTRRGRRRR